MSVIEDAQKTDDRLPAEIERKLLKVFLSWLAMMGVILAGIAGGAAYLLNASIVEAGKTDYQRIAYEQANTQLGAIQQRMSTMDSQLNILREKNYSTVADMKGNVEIANHLLAEVKQSLSDASKAVAALQQVVTDNEKITHSLSDAGTIQAAISKDEFKDSIASKVSEKLQGTALEAVKDVTKEINKQFTRLTSESQNGYSFSNTSTPTGAGYSPDVPPGRCPAGSYVVGIQPLPIGAGGGGIRFACAQLPALSVGSSG